MLMSIELLIAVLGSSFLTSLMNGLVNRRKNRIDIDEKINQMASRLIDDQREEIDSLNGHILLLHKEYEEVKAENALLKKEIAELKACNSSYKQQALKRKEENAYLRKEFDKLKELRGLGE